MVGEILVGRRGRQRARPPLNPPDMSSEPKRTGTPSQSVLQWKPERQVI